MRLLTVGDSFTYGEELADLNSAWPYLLANKLGWEVTNLGMPSAGNTYMIRTIVNEIDNHDVFIIAWTHWARIESADASGIYDIWPGYRSDFLNQTISHRSLLVDYINRYHDDEYLINQHLIGVKLLESFLESKNKKYVMVSAYGSPIKTNITFKNYIEWPNGNMQTWTWENHCPKGSGGHFLEQGHKVVADKIYEYIRNIGWVS